MIVKVGEGLSNIGQRMGDRLGPLGAAGMDLDVEAV